jgi:hypothetical protein
MYFNILLQLKSLNSHSMKIVIYAVVFKTWLITVNIILFFGGWLLCDYYFFWVLANL